MSSLLLVLVLRGRGSGRSDNPVMDHHGGECRGFSLASVHRFYPENSVSKRVLELGLSIFRKEYNNGSSLIIIIILVEKWNRDHLPNKHSITCQNSYIPSFRPVTLHSRADLALM